MRCVMKRLLSLIPVLATVAIMLGTTGCYTQIAVRDEYPRYDEYDAPDYSEKARAAIREMYHQVGDLVIDNEGIAVRGLLIRHLVLPEGLADTGNIMRFIFRDISPNTYVNIMSQYRPWGRAFGFPPLNRRLAPGEYQRAIETARTEGISRLDGPIQRFL